MASNDRIKFLSQVKDFLYVYTSKVQTVIQFAYSLHAQTGGFAK